MKNSIFFSIGLFFLSHSIFSQSNNFQLPISINTDGSDPHESALLEIKSTDKGILIPRVADASSLVAPSSGFAEGLLVYQTDGDSGFYYFDGSSWQKVGGSGSGDDLGNHTATQALQLATMTTDQRDMISAAAGMLIYNTDIGRPQFFKEDDPVTLIDVDNNGFTSTGASSIAQSFKLVSTLLVTAIKAKIDFNGNMDSIVFKIYDGVGTAGVELYSENYVLSSLPVINGNEFTFTLSTPLLVPVSQDRTFEISQFANNNMTAHRHFVDNQSYNVSLGEQSPDPYGNGKLFINGVNSDPAIIQTVNGMGQVILTVTSNDLEFELTTQNKQWVTQ